MLCFRIVYGMLLSVLGFGIALNVSAAQAPEDGSVLPFPPPRSTSIAASSMQDSKYNPQPEKRRLPADVPNILIVLIDDAGPGLPDTYGGEAHTPTLTRIAKTGISYNRFHTTAMCSPTRAALLTGRNHHRVGAGVITKLGNDWDGYTGMWPATSASLARVLGCYGYATSAFGKWHNTPDDQVSQVGPFDRWPTGRLVGFDYFYGFLAGESSQYEPLLVENFTHLPSRPYDGKYHLTEDLADRAINWLRRQRAQAPDQPFFMYWAPGGVHGPHQVANQWADKYKGKFDDGWDRYRERVYARQQELGYLPADAKLTSRPESMPGWDEIPDTEKPFQRRLMEVFAGYCEHTDTQAGRVIDELESLGVRDNTLVFYIWGDNGSSAEGQGGTVSEYLAQSGTQSKISDHLKVVEEFGGLEALGGPEFESMYHAGWAWAGSTPYKSTKLVAAHFGGTRNPLAISWPKVIKPDAKIRSQFHHVNDVVPTIYEILSLKEPTIVDGVSQDPMDGVSMRYTFDSAETAGQKHSQYFEIMGSRAYYRDGWIASAFGPRIPWKPGIDPKVFSWNPDKEPWELYNLESDFTQAVDLAREQPEKLKEMVSEFLVEARDNKVFPIGGGLWTAIHPEFAKQNPATEFFYNADVIEVPEATAPRLAQRSNLVTVEAELDDKSSGVLYAVGCMSGGLAVWIDDGKLTYEYNLYHIERTRIQSSQPLPSGKLKLEVETTMQPGVRNGPAEVVIRANGEVIGQGKVPRTTGYALSGNDSFDVGRDSYSPVSPLYEKRAPFAFNGKIEALTVRYKTAR
ncbi:MAG: arylsulfatase [Planctomycetota bacterium]